MPPQTPYQPQPNDSPAIIPPAPLGTIDPAPVAQPTPMPPQPAPAGHHLVHNLIMTCVLLVILAVVFVGGVFTHISISHRQETNAATTARAFIHDLNQNDLTVAYSRTSLNLQKKESLSQFTAALSNLTAARPKMVSSLTTHNDGVAVYTEVEDGLAANASGQTTATWTIQLVRSGLTGWLIDSAHVQ